MQQSVPKVPSDTPAAAWQMLALGVGAQAGGTFLVSAPAYLIPMLHAREGMSLAIAGLLAATPTIGKVLTLVAWGALADRFGERWVIGGGLALASLFAFAATITDGYAWLGIFLVLGGAASASTDAASGRVIVGWFPRRRRGLAMGIRQMAQPLGVAAAALIVPSLAESQGLSAPLFAAGVVTLFLAAACAMGLRDAPRSTPTARADASGGTPPILNPYKRSSFLTRIHTVSALLVVPQFTLTTFSLVWLTAGLGWEAGPAGIVVAVSQFIGAGGRIVIGVASDRLGTRVGVMRWVALTGATSMLLLAVAGATGWAPAAAAMLVIASTISVADNGLAFTSVAEAAGPSWSGKALGIQNTGQFVAASAVGPVIGALIGFVGYPLAFAIVAAAPLASWRLIPQHDDHWDEADHV